MLRMSQELKIALKLGERPMYKVAFAAGLSPATLSKLLRGGVRLQENDVRIAAIAREVGIPVERCIEGKE